VSWIVASFVLLGAALAVGFGWYERTHPSARVLALVATLAALAALGRIAFAPLPNVKPTTDIVLLTGYVLGGAPGFAVGAVAALASNLFFGQGPWTPWQMAGWAGAGLLGAGLARLFGRELGRISLAAACALAGLLFGAVMNLSMWVTYSGDHTLEKLGAFFVTSLPFDLAHAVGNALFCLAFGPALVRALRRYRTRFEVTWRPAPAATATLGAALLGALVVLAAPSDDARADAPKAAIRYLERAQNRDGGFGPAPGAGSTQMHTGWAAIGLAAAGRNPRDLEHDAIAYIRGHAGALRGDLGERSRTILAMRAAGLERFKAGGRNLLAEIERAQEPDGSWQGLVNTTAFAVLALRAAGRPADSGAVRAGVEFIAGQANEDGGFNFAGAGRPSGADDTGAALQALGAAGKRRSGVARRAVAWLESRQNADGGFSLQGGPSNAQSTAWAVQGLIAAGRNPRRVRRDGSRSPVAYLRSLVGSNGAIRYSRTSTQTPVWVTSQAVAALEGKALPLKPVPRARKPKAVAAPAPTATPAPAPRPAPTAAPEAARTPERVPPVVDGLGVAEPELQDEDGERVSLDEIVPQMPSPLEVAFARVVAMPVGPSAGEMGALAAVLVRFWRPPAAAV
jgi:energy-coupling factor transport system substrate-specific component